MSPPDVGQSDQQLPEEMVFSMITSPPAQHAARLGLLRLPNRKLMQTPHYLGVASRGVVPHLSPDNYDRLTDIGGVYTALEDCEWLPPCHIQRMLLSADQRAYTKTEVLERQAPLEPPVYNFRSGDTSSPLRHFTGLPDSSLLVLGPRRTPPIPCPTSSTPTSIFILTSVGYRQLPIKEYTLAAHKLRPDIIIGPGDIPYGVDKVSSKKLYKITDRSSKWMLEFVKARHEITDEADTLPQRPLLCAPLLPVDISSQSYYVDHLVKQLLGELGGLAVYDTCALRGMPAQLGELPRIGFTEPKNPNTILREIAQGMDVLTVPFVGAATDAGIALDFSFLGKAPTSNTAPRALGVDMWQISHAVDLSPLSCGCSCYACTKHHRAYLQHLLSAKEMLGWVLLQIHNHHVTDQFFADIRLSISRGSFEEDTASFQRRYEPELPAKTGQGPRSVHFYSFASPELTDGRVRGYQFRADGPSQKKANPPAFQNLSIVQEKLLDVKITP